MQFEVKQLITWMYMTWIQKHTVSNLSNQIHVHAVAIKASLIYSIFAVHYFCTVNRDVK